LQTCWKKLLRAFNNWKLCCKVQQRLAKLYRVMGELV